MRDDDDDDVQNSLFGTAELVRLLLILFEFAKCAQLTRVCWPIE